MLTPIIVLTIWIMAIPPLLLYMKTEPRVFAVTSGAVIVSGAFISGAAIIEWFVLTILFLVPAVVMGEGYRRKSTARAVITNGTVAFLALFLVGLIITSALGFDLNRAIGSAMIDMTNRFPSVLQGEVTGAELTAVIERTVMMVPLYLVGNALLLAMITHAVGRRLLQKLHVEAAALRPIREWRLPRPFVWYYLIALLISLLLPADDTSFVTTIIVNLVPILMFAFAVQGLAFLFFLGNVKRKAWIGWTGLVLMFPLFSAFSLLGVFDTAFPLRDRLRKS